MSIPNKTFNNLLTNELFSTLHDTFNYCFSSDLFPLILKIVKFVSVYQKNPTLDF